MAPLFLSKSQAERSIAWLQVYASPPVLYLTRRHILGDDPASSPMRELWKTVEDGPAAQALFSRQNEDGTWFSGGPWGPRGYQQTSGRGFSLTQPKFVTTAWLLPFLGDMGFTVADARVEKSCQHLLAEIASGARPTLADAGAVNCCGLTGIPLRAGERGIGRG